jgi:hypothetical protein
VRTVRLEQGLYTSKRKEFGHILQRGSKKGLLKSNSKIQFQVGLSITTLTPILRKHMEVCFDKVIEVLVEALKRALQAYPDIKVPTQAF